MRWINQDDNPLIVAALLACLVVLMLVVLSLEPPEPLPLDAPAEVFSGMRAAATLADLLGDETPHPVGSAANRAVRDRLIGTLNGLGLDAQVQRTVGCSQKVPVCARVENVLAEIPGQTRDAVVLMAHYDSVPHAPGAADDGSGVVTLLESARALLLEPARRNRVLLVFTDAEEMGLLGAEGFYADHPWVTDIKAVVNVEGSGSGGPALLLRTSDPGGHLLRAFRDSAESPVAISYAQEVFARLPNDTDFTVSDRAGIASIDFAFAFEFNHYHTPLDNLANLDHGTLQHHGGYVLPLSRALAAMDLNIPAPNFSYLTVQQSWWITWPVGWTLGLAILGLAALLGTGYRLRKAIRPRALLGGLLLAGSGLVLSLAGCFAVLWLAVFSAGATVNFPAAPWPWRLLMFAAALTPISLLSWWIGDRLPFWARFLGVWLIIGLLGLGLALAAPLAANLLLVPLLIAAFLGLLLVLFFPAAELRAQAALGLVATAALAYFMLSVSYAMEQTQGLRLAPAIYMGVALVMLTFLCWRSGPRICMGLSGLLLAGWIWVGVAPLYSEWRPQHVSLYYILDRDEGVARWSAVTRNPLPERLIDAFGAAPQRQPIVPWAPNRTVPSFEAEVVTLPVPEVAVERADSVVNVRITSQGSGDFTQLVLPESAGIDNLTIAGQPVAARSFSGFVQARFFAAGNEPVTFSFTVSETGSFEGYIVDGSHQLPDIGKPLSSARGKLAVPQHQGDQQLAFQRFQF